MPVISDKNPLNAAGIEKKMKMKSGESVSSDIQSVTHMTSDSSDEGKVWEILIREINPERCRPWKYHNRDVAWLTRERCKDLIHSIQKNGQNEPSLVREIKDDPEYDFELIYGVRRWFACSEIPGQKLLAQVTNADDKNCMILMHSENACSKDISEFERAFSFAQQMKSGVFRNQTEMAMAMGVTQGTISKMIKSAEILEHLWLKDLFLHKLDIPVKQAYTLSMLLKNPMHGESIKKEAYRIQEEFETTRRYQGAPNILKRLIKSVNVENNTALDSIFLTSGNRPVVHCRRDKVGKICIVIEDEAKSLSRSEVEAACLKAIADCVYGLFPEE